MRVLAYLALLSPCASQASTVQLYPSLPRHAVSQALQLDAASNIYLAGSFSRPGDTNVAGSSKAFVAKLSPDGSQLLYFTVLGGSSGDTAAALAIGLDGSAYVAGSTYSTDFPVTPGALETSFSGSGLAQGFLARLDPSGQVAYSTFINGTAFTQVTGIALDNAQNVFLTGTGGPDYPVSSLQPIQGFFLKVDASLSRILLSTYGYGGGLIQVDAQGGIYLAGKAQPVQNALPAFPAQSFQSAHAFVLCEESLGPGGPFQQYCPYQYVAKLDASANLVWGTYITGTFGAAIGGMAVDSAGNVIVAGATNSSDFPVTPGALQQLYSAAAPPIPGSGVGFIGPPNATGFVAKVNSSGTGLLWSTYFGGTYQDQITGMAVDANGGIVISGRAGSSDLPGLEAVPAGCRPSPNQVLGFVARLTPDGASTSGTQLIQGAPECLYTSCGGLAEYQTGRPIALRPDGSAVTAGANGSVASVDFNGASRFACMTDPADNAQINSVAPGQLVAVFGLDLLGSKSHLGPPDQPPTLTFNGIAAPLLYSSPQQINAQVPFEIAGSDAVQLTLQNRDALNPLSESRTLAVAAQQPSIFLSAAALESPYPTYDSCGTRGIYGQAALALNQDGTVNSCANPAAVGSIVTVFVNGFGQVSPALVTGALALAPASALPLTVDPGLVTQTKVTAFETVPGAISGLAQLQLQVVSPLPSLLLVDPTLAGVPFRDRVIFVWLQ